MRLPSSSAPSPWYAPRYVLPILGMVLGNTLTSVSLALQALSEGAIRERNAIDARIALGATRFAGLRRRAAAARSEPPPRRCSTPWPWRAS